MMNDPSDRATALGRDLLLDGRHLARCRDSEAAAVIAMCLNRARVSDDMPSWHYANADEKRIQEFFA